MKRVKVSQLISADQFGCSEDYFEKFIRGKFFRVVVSVAGFVFFEDKNSPDRTTIQGISYDWAVPVSQSRTKIAVVDVPIMPALLKGIFGEDSVLCLNNPQKKDLSALHEKGVEDILLSDPTKEEESLNILLLANSVIGEKKTRFTLHFPNLFQDIPEPQRKLELLKVFTSQRHEKLEDIEKAFSNPFLKLSFRKLEKLLD